MPAWEMHNHPLPLTFLPFLCLSTSLFSVFCYADVFESLPTAEEVPAEDLLLVQVIHRHGEREALFDIPSAGNSEKKTGLFPFAKEAQLTPNGVRQMYEYGQFMRQRYHKYFEDGQLSSSQRIRVISSATDRTISSAQALIAGLLPPNGTLRQWNSTLGAYWNPFPVYTRPSKHDGLLLNFNDDCPAFSVLRANIGSLPIAQQLQEEMKGFIEDVKRASGIKNYDFFETSSTIEDAARYMQAYPGRMGVNNSNWPVWLNDTMIEDFERIAGMRMHLLVGGNGDRLRTRFRAGNLLYELFDRMYAAQKNNGTQLLKMVQYSGHDENVAAILAALNLYNYTLNGPNLGIPEFTASIIMELHKNHTVRLLFKNDPVRMWAEPKVLQHPQCQVPFCPLDKLYDLLKDVIVTEDQWMMECGLGTAVLRAGPSGPVIGLPESLVIGGTLIAFAIIFAAVVVLCMFLLHRRRKSRMNVNDYGTTFEFLNTNGHSART